MTCLFCAIANKEVKSHIVYEDEQTIAFLDIQPIRPGHMLVIPKRHREALHTLGEQEYIDVMKAVRLLSKQVNDTLRPKKVGVAIAGFDQAHLHIHIIPMHAYHDLTSSKYLDKSIAIAKEEELLAMKQLLAMNK
ncbi:HIT family protein [Shouchella clausii]|uniref:HIT family protein n=1 Tax=Shouchella clausii TaxID=79880 RepID=UPI003982FC74